jgi:hypothetical protein
MRQVDLRIGVQLDHHRAWLYVYRPGEDPGISFILGNVPRGIRRVVEDYMTRTVKSDRDKHIQDLFRRLDKGLAGATDVVLFGPGTAKDEMANRMAKNASLKAIPVRTAVTEWLDETGFEEFAREKLNVAASTPRVYRKEEPYAPNRRLGGPGAPVSSSDYRRRSEPKWKDSSMEGRKST